MSKNEQKNKEETQGCCNCDCGCCSGPQVAEFLRHIANFFEKERS